DLVIRRGVGTPPRTPREGTLLEQGPPQPDLADPAVPLIPAPIYYTAFLRRATASGPLFSAGVSGELLASTPEALREYAESQAQAPGAENELPPGLRLCFRALGPLQVSEALLTSRAPQVRRWAIA